MKRDHWIIVVAVLSVVALGGMAAFNTTIGQQQAELIERQKELDQLAAEVYWTRLSLRAPPYHPPLEQARISSGTGYRMDPMGGGTEGLHKGVDLVAPGGTPVVAVMDGVVVEHWPSPNTYWKGHPVFGGLVVLDHGDGLFSIYGHLKFTYVHEGLRVGVGQVIGRLGSTGISTGPHLHFEVVVDPLRYLEER